MTIFLTSLRAYLPVVFSVLSNNSFHYCLPFPLIRLFVYSQSAPSSLLWCNCTVTLPDRRVFRSSTLSSLSLTAFIREISPLVLFHLLNTIFFVCFRAEREFWDRPSSFDFPRLSISFSSSLLMDNTPFLLTLFHRLITPFSNVKCTNSLIIFRFFCWTISCKNKINFMIRCKKFRLSKLLPEKIITGSTNIHAFSFSEKFYAFERQIKNAMSAQRLFVLGPIFEVRRTSWISWIIVCETLSSLFRLVHTRTLAIGFVSEREREERGRKGGRVLLDGTED